MALNKRPLLGARIVGLNVRVWALADIRQRHEYPLWVEADLPYRSHDRASRKFVRT